DPGPLDTDHIASAQVGDVELFSEPRPFQPGKAIIALAAFAGAVALATLNVAPIAATAFAGAVLLILLRVITADEAYGGLRPEILILIAGMVVIGIAMEESGLAAEAADLLIRRDGGLSPRAAIIARYLMTVVLAEVVSNATGAGAGGGLRPEVLILIAGMVVIGIAMEESGLAAEASNLLISSVDGLSPLAAIIVLYLMTMVLTELLSNATVAVLVTPLAVALAE